MNRFFKMFLASMVLVGVVSFALTETFAAKKQNLAAQTQVSREEVPDPSGFPQGETWPITPRPLTTEMSAPIAPGIYTVGAAGTYTSLKQAIDSLNFHGVVGPGAVIFEFIDAAYTDSLGRTIGPYPGQGVGAPVIFRPATGVSARIRFTLGSATFAVRLDSASGVTIDGSNSGGTDRSLVLEADTTGNRNVVVIQRGSNNITLKNTIFEGTRRSAGNGLDVVRIANTANAASQHTILIENCQMARGLGGIFQAGARNTAGSLAGASLDYGITITKNLIGGGSSSDDLYHLSGTAVTFSACTLVVVDQNDINGVKAFGAPNAFRINGGAEVVFTRNKAHNLVTLAPIATRPFFTIIGNALAVGPAVKNRILISNNMFYDQHNFGPGTSGRGFEGIFFNTNAGANGDGVFIELIHNTYAWETAAGEGGDLTLFVYDGNSFGGGTGAQADSMIMKNNVSSTKRAVGFTRSFLIFPPTVATNFTWISDNNLFHQADAGSFGQYPTPWPTGASGVSPLFSDWQTITGNDLASKQGDPRFVSYLDPHINSSVGVVSAVDSVGTPYPGKTFDIDGNVRDVARPDAGAHEVTVTRYATDLEATSVVFPTPTQILAENAAFSPQGLFTNRGSTTLSGASSVICEILNSVPAVVYSGPTTISVGGFDNTAGITFPSVVGGLAAGSYTIRVIAAIPGDANAANDTVTSTLFVQASITSASFPYLEDFEDPGPEAVGGAGWLTAAEPGSPNDWVIGTPAKAQLSGAHSGTKAYVTKTTGNYTDNQKSYIFAPILDLSSFTGLLLVEFYSNFRFEAQWDGGDMQMSTDGGFTWVKVDPTLGTGANYNTPSGTAWYNESVQLGGLSHIQPPYFSGDNTLTPSSAGYATQVAGWVKSSTVVSGVAGLPDVRFRWFLDADGASNDQGWAIDDVKFDSVPTDDIGLEAFGIPNYVGGPIPELAGVMNSLPGKKGSKVNPIVLTEGAKFPAYIAGAPVDFKAQTRNFGANAQATYSVNWDIDLAPQGAVSNIDTLEFGDIDTLSLTWASPTAGIHTARAWTELVGDVDPSNDTLSFAFEVLPPEVVFYEGFNGSVWPPPGWDTLNVDGNTGSFKSWLPNLIGPPQEGNRAATSAYLSANGFYIDDWMISPNTGGLLDASFTVDTLTFYVTSLGSGFPDSLMIMVSTTDTDPGSFTALDYIEAPVGAWGKFTYALPDAATRYIAFRYLHYDGGPSGGSSNAMGIDNMRITRYSYANGFVANPDEVTFGSVPVGFSNNQVIRVSNPGNFDLTVSAVNWVDPNFSIAPTSGVVPAGDSIDFVITFEPLTGGAHSVNFEFVHDGDSSPDFVTAFGTGGAALEFLSVTPDTIISKDPIKGKLLKPAKRGKGLYPNWANLLDETVAQGGFAPGTSESDDAGGMVVGISHMFEAGPGKWKPIKDSTKTRGWVRLTKWNFAKLIGKSSNAVQKTLEDKTGKHDGTPRGLDLTTDGKNKPLLKQITKLTPKKHDNSLFAELVALKLNIAASQLGKLPGGFGDLVYDNDGNAYDEMSVMEISAKADTMMTYWQGISSGDYSDLHAVVSSINAAFAGPLDTVSFEGGIVTPKLVLKGQVNLASVSYLKLPSPFVPTRISPTTNETESEIDEFDDAEWEDGDGIPVAAKLYQNYPNPFNPSTTIAFQLREASVVTVKVFNLLGQEVLSLLNNEEVEEGINTVEFNATSLSSGIYFYQINAQGLEDGGLRTLETKKMVLLK